MRAPSRRTGTVYPLPLSYRNGPDGAWLVSTTRRRTWWRNLDPGADVTRIRGTERTGRARLVQDPITATELMSLMLHGRRIDARAYGLTLNGSGDVDTRELMQIVDGLAIIEICPT